MQLFSPLQKEFLVNPLLDLNILVGVTGSGKSYIANIKFLYELYKAPQNALLMIVAKSAESAFDNVISQLLKLDGGISLEFKNVQHHQRLICKSNNAQVAVVGAYSEGSEDRIIGKSIYLLYIDEFNKIPQRFVEVAFSRCRWNNEKTGKLEIRPIIATLNPSNPSSFVKRNYIDKINQLNGKIYTFNFEDNPTIENPEEHKNKLLLTHTGALRDNLILGKWSTDDDAVLPEFDRNKHVKEYEKPQYYIPYVSIDLGYTDHTAALIGYYDFKNCIYVIDNEFILKQPTILDIKKSLDVLEQGYDSTKIKRFSDNDLLVLSELNRVYNVKITATKKDDKEAQINNLRVLLQQNKIYINPKCENLIVQCETVSFNKNHTSYNRVDEHHFDLVDALLYLIRNINIKENPVPPVIHDRNDWFIDEKQQKIEQLKRLGNIGELANIIKR